MAVSLERGCGTITKTSNKPNLGLLKASLRVQEDYISSLVGDIFRNIYKDIHPVTFM